MVVVVVVGEGGGDAIGCGTCCVVIGAVDDEVASYCNYVLCDCVFCRLFLFDKSLTLVCGFGEADNKC